MRPLILAAAVIMTIAAVILIEIPSPQWREGYYIIEGNITVTVPPDRVEPLPGKTCYLSAPHLDAPVLFYVPRGWNVYIGHYSLDKMYIAVRGLGYGGLYVECPDPPRCYFVKFGVPSVSPYCIEIDGIHLEYSYVVYGATCELGSFPPGNYSISDYWLQCIYVSAYWPDYNRYALSIAGVLTRVERHSRCMLNPSLMTDKIYAYKVADRIYVYVAHPNITITEPLTFINCRLYYSEWKAALLDKSIGTWWTR